MFKKLKIKRGLFTSRLICRAAILFALCGLPVMSTAQLFFGAPSVSPSELRWGEDYQLSLIAISGEQPTQATTLTLYIEEGGVSKNIDETPYGLADEFLPLQRQIVIPSVEMARSSRQVLISGKAGRGIGGTTRIRYCDDSQTLCTQYSDITYLRDPPSHNINGRYQVSIANSTVESGATCVAVREREQQVRITQTDSTASYQYTDDFGKQALLSASVSTNTYVFTAQYSTAPAFPGTRTFIVGAEFSDNDNGRGRAYWSYKTNNGDLCEGSYDVQYTRLAEPPQPDGLLVQLRVLPEGLLIDDSVIAASVTVPQRVQDTVLSQSGALYALKDDHTIWLLSPSGLRYQLAGATADGGEIDIHDLIFVQRSDSSDTLYIVDALLRAVIAVDLSDGSRTVVSGCDIINRCPVGHYKVGSGVPLIQPTDAVLDEGANRLIVADAYLAALIAVDLSDGTRTVVSGCTSADSCPADEQNVGDGITFLHPQAMDINSSTTRIVVVDDTLDALFAVDVVTGDRAVASGCRLRSVCLIEEIGIGPSFDKPTAVVLDDDVDLAYVADAGLAAIVEVDLNNGDRSSVLSPITVRTPYHLALDEEGNRVLAYNEADGSLQAISQSDNTSVRLTTYTRTQDPSATPPPTPQGLVAEVRGDVVVLDWRAVAQATSYKIYWNTFADISAGRADRVIDNLYTTGYVHSRLERGRVYYYAVSAVNEQGESALAAAVSVMLPELTSNDEIAPTAPVIVSIHASSTTAVALDWMAAVDDRSAAEHIVYEVHAAESTATVVSEDTKRVTVQGIYSAGVDGLEASRTYYVSVAALDEAGNRSLSEMIAIRTMENPSIISTRNEIMLVSGMATLDDQGVLMIPQQDDLKDGQVIIGEDQEGGYLRRITRVEEDGNQVRVYTEEASLNDVFEELDLNFAVKFENIDDDAAIAAAKSAAVRAAQQDEPAPPADAKLRQFSPTLQSPVPVPNVWPYQPIYDGDRQILEMRWPDSGFILRQSQPISQTDDTESALDGIGLRSEQQAPATRVPGTYARTSNDDIRVFYPATDIFAAAKRGNFDVYIERRNKNCTIESLSLERVTHRGRNLGTLNIAIRAKNTGSQSAVVGYGLSWRPPKSFMDDEPYRLHLIAASSCSALNFSVSVYVPDPDKRIVIHPIDEKLPASSPDNKLKLETDLKLRFNPELTINAQLHSGNLKKALVIVSGELDLNTVMKAIATEGIEWKSKERQLGKDIKFSKLIPVKPIPIYVSGTLKLLWYVNSNMSGSANITQNFDANYRTSYGFNYVAGKGFKPIRGEDSSSEYKITVQSVAGALVEFAVVPQLEMRVYGSPVADTRLESKVYGDGELEGTFSYSKSSDFNEAATDARYRFTKLEAGLGLAGDVRAELKLLGGPSLASWPGGGEFYPLFRKTYPLFSLPQIQLRETADNNYTATITPGRWFAGDNTMQNHNWQVVPSEGAPTITRIGTNSVRLDATEDIGDREYKLRYTGHSRYGKPFLQYEEIAIGISDEPEMIIVPSGTFTMGSPADEPYRHSDEGPQHQVRIQSFAVGKYEVTRGQFAAFVAATGYDVGNCNWPSGYNWRYPRFTQTDTHPVVCVSWNDAKAYTNWLSKKTGQNYRLLTEAEWEYVARAGTTTAYHFGATISPSKANYDWNNDGTVIVGSYRANAFGLHDVHGNVWEWVEDCWHNNYNGAPSDGSAWTSNCYYGDNVRVLRGGSWISDPWDLRSAVRGRSSARNRVNDDGFRIARTLTP